MQDISIDRHDFDAGFLITFRKKSNFTLQKAMIFGQQMTIIIITIIKHHYSKHYINSIFIKLTIIVCVSLKIPLYNIPDVDETFSIGAL